MSNTDLSNFLAQQLLAAAQLAITEAGQPMPAIIMQAGGVGVPAVDPCDGLLWVRVAMLMPGDGSANQFSEARIGWGIPGWVHSIELGVLWCHPVIEGDGSAIDYSEWDAMAARDGEYRSALMNAVAYLYPPLVNSCAGGQTIQPWVPIGPDGGYSGGLIVSHTVANFLRT